MNTLNNNYILYIDVINIIFLFFLPIRALWLLREYHHHLRPWMRVIESGEIGVYAQKNRY